MRLRQTDKSWKQLFVPRTRSRGVHGPILDLLNLLIKKYILLYSVGERRRGITNAYKLHHHITMLPIPRGISRAMHQLNDIYSPEAAMELDQVFF